MSALDELYQVILDGERHQVVGLVQRALDEGVAPMTIIERTLRTAMNEVGERFSSGQYYLPNLLLAASAMKMAMERLQPLLAGEAGASKQETIVIGTVQGDLHDIGKNLVVATLEGAGYRVVDLGIDVPPEGFVNAVRENKPVVVGLSALLSTTMVNIPRTIRAIEEAGLRSGQMLIAVGGAPVTPRSAEQWGADLHASDAGTAVRIINDALAQQQ